MYEYLNLLAHITAEGERRNTRAGETLAVFGQTLRFNLGFGFPAVTTKKLYFESVKSELAGFLRAETDANKIGSDIWKADAKRWHEMPGSLSMFPSDMGRVYGVQMRQWENGECWGPIDQLQNAVDLVMENPMDRRILVSMWNPGEMDQMCLPPCHYAFQFFVSRDQKLSCMFHMRSVDLVLGLPFDIAYYALLTHIVAQQCNLFVGDLICTLGDTHIYANHLNVVNELLGRQPYDLPTLSLHEEATIDKFSPGMASLLNYKHHPPISAKLNVG